MTVVTGPSSPDLTTIKVDIAASSDLIAAVAGKRIVVTGFFLVNTTVGTTLKFQSGGSTDLTGVMTNGQSVYAYAGNQSAPILVTNVGEKLNIVLGAGTQVSGSITYYTV